MILVIETPYNTIQVGKIINNMVHIDDLIRAHNMMRPGYVLRVYDENMVRGKTLLKF